MTLSEKVDKNVSLHSRLDRHSGTGTRGLPKKDGYGKFGWGTNGETFNEEDLDKDEINEEQPAQGNKL
eukprot:gene17465-20839_t